MFGLFIDIQTGKASKEEIKNLRGLLKRIEVGDAEYFKKEK